MEMKLKASAVALALTVAAAPAAASTDLSAAPMSCRATGWTNAYAYANQPIEFVPRTFHEFACDKDGMRIYKSVADTRAEVRVLRGFAGDNNQRVFLMAFCQTGPSRAHIIDAAWLYHGRRANAVEREHYPAWLARFADRHDCRVF